MSRDVHETTAPIAEPAVSSQLWNPAGGIHTEIPYVTVDHRFPRFAAIDHVPMGLRNRVAAQIAGRNVHEVAISVTA